jgi:hypothetical protein
VQC